MPTPDKPADAVRSQPNRWPQPTARLDPTFKGFGQFELSPWPDRQKGEQKGVVGPMHFTGIHLGRQITSDSFIGLRYELEPPAAAPFPNGYHFPPKHSLGESLKIRAKAFWNYVRTPIGFLVTLYCLNVVGWGGMIFLLSLNAAPAMCNPSCDDEDSARKIWIEIDAQVLNALFCVIGIGLAPWRFKQLYLLMRYRLGNIEYLRRLAGIHRQWYRLAGSTNLPPFIGPQNVEVASLESQLLAIPSPETKIPDAPLTGMRAPSTRPWKLDMVIWMKVSNSLLQAGLAALMWGFSRFDRPTWATSSAVFLACTVGTVEGIILIKEKKRIKRVEGVPVSQKDLDRLRNDRARGIWHYNNIKDKDLSGKH
ncbi:hypothetical protein XA68_14385 [Ophiocordyceps unilateralis]|uniref:Uncharacterized protein n=1 Tax=Ophiocordyceps unilateralis TaxID=268505 RepID=A0A2A9PM11_OPHUN|nr:hypothetical protein XA68_14385 [Ophiocordyceps unilateralis]